MAAAGYDVAAGDTWALNELSSAVRQGTGNARANMRAFLNGLYDGDGALPTPVERSSSPGSDKERPISRSTRRGCRTGTRTRPSGATCADADDWSQEVYGDVRHYAVAGARPGDTARPAERVPPAPDGPRWRRAAAAAAARSFLAASSSPLANAAWRYDTAFGWTNVPVELMEDYVSAQTYAMRSAGHRPLRLRVVAEEPRGHPGGGLRRADRRAARPARRGDRRLGRHAGRCLRREWCTAQPRGRGRYGRLEHVRSLEALAARVHVAGADDGAGCRVDPADRRAPDERRHAYAAGLPSTSRFRRPRRRASFSTSPDGPWATTLTAPIASGVTTASFYFRDGGAGAATITAAAAGKTAATQAIAVGTPPPAPPTASGGGGQAPDLVVQASAIPAAPAVGGSITYTVTVRNLGGPAARALLAVQLPAQVAYTGSQSDRGPGCTGTTALTCDLDFLAGDLVATVRISGVVREAGTLAFAAVSSAQPADPQPANDTALVSTVVGPRAAVGSPALVRPTLRAVGTPTRPTRVRGVATVSVRFSVGSSARLEGRLTTRTSTRPITLLAGSSLAGVRSTKAQPAAAARVSRAGTYVFRAKVGAARLIRGRTYLARLTVVDAEGRRRTLSIRVKA